MKQKVINILDCMVREAEERSVGVKSYEQVSDNIFKLETELSQFGHQTRLRYEATGDNEMFRIELTHTFGYLDVRIDPQHAAAQLLLMLEKNTGSFESTTAFIGVERKDKLYVTLNSFHHFVTAWNDKEIAKALTLHFFDLTMGFMVRDGSLTMLKIFGD